MCDKMRESIILEKNEKGDFVNKLQSNLSESYLVFENDKDLNELKKNNYNTIAKQNSLHDITNVVENTRNYQGIYSAYQYLKSFTRFIPFLI